MVSKSSSRFCPLAVCAAMLKITKAAPFSAGEATIFFRRQAEFAIGLLAGRLALAVDWLGSTPATRDLPLGLFGASTGAAAVLNLAAQRPRQVGAMVARGGRPDLAGQAALADVCAPARHRVRNAALRAAKIALTSSSGTPSPESSRPRSTCSKNH